MCYAVLLNCLCWLVLRNGENSINLSIVGHLCALIDAVPVSVGHKIQIDIDYISHWASHCSAPVYRVQKWSELLAKCFGLL